MFVRIPGSMEEHLYTKKAINSHRDRRSLPSAALLSLILLLVLALLADIPPGAARNVPDTGVSVATQRKLDQLMKIRHRQRRSDDCEDYYDADYRRVQKCYDDEDTNELCQRCSKVTKSSMVFPMCCSNEDDTMNWCKAYVYYGIQN